MNVFKAARRLIDTIAMKMTTPNLTLKEVSVLTKQYLENNKHVLDTIQRIEKLSGEKITTLGEWLRFVNRNTSLGRSEKDGMYRYAWHTSINDVKLSEQQGICCVELVDYEGFPLKLRKEYMAETNSLKDRIRFDRKAKGDLKHN